MSTRSSQPIDSGIDVLVAGDDDDFNPRADEFGDFESAFTGNTESSVQPNICSNVTNGKAANDEFADFASFPASTLKPAVINNSKATNISNTDLLSDLGNVSGGSGVSFNTGPDLFSSIGAPVPAIPVTNTSLGGINNVTADLLSDFGGISLESSGEFKIKINLG